MIKYFKSFLLIDADVILVDSQEARPLNSTTGGFTARALIAFVVVGRRSVSSNGLFEWAHFHSQSIATLSSEL